MELDKTPKEIYLQHRSDDTYGEQTWCEDKINDTDVKYVRADQPRNEVIDSEGEDILCINMETYEPRHFTTHKKFIGLLGDLNHKKLLKERCFVSTTTAYYLIGRK